MNTLRKRRFRKGRPTGSLRAFLPFSVVQNQRDEFEVLRPRVFEGVAVSAVANGRVSRADFADFAVVGVFAFAADEIEYLVVALVGVLADRVAGRERHHVEHPALCVHFVRAV